MIKIWSLLALVVVWSTSEAATRCDRRPFRTTHHSTVSNGRFTMNAPQVESDKYLPDQQYLLTLTASDRAAHPFTAFMIWPEGHAEPNSESRRVSANKDSGTMRVHDQYPVKISDRCPNTIEMINAAPNGYVEMFWKSPVRGNGCVTLHAMVAENDELWYQDGDGLEFTLCEDDSFLGDLSSVINCTICEEAKYELTFQGKWSRNTHPQKYPRDEWSVFYGDLIGASHSSDYSMWKDRSSASDAMKELAMFNNTDQIQEEILQNYAQGKVRTLIKGKGHGQMNKNMNNPTYALVRVDKFHHLISTATAMKPSPDWFLGVSDYELCQKDNTWLQNKTVELIPWDAGVNGGISFESAYEQTSDTIGRVRVGSFDKESPFYNMNYKQVKPFATLNFRLIQTYAKNCEEEDTNVRNNGDGIQEPEQPESPARRTSPPPQNIAESDASGENAGGESGSSLDEECPLSEWDEWTSCSNQCGTGYRSRSRYHVVNGVQYRYYRPDERIPGRIKEPSENCIERHKGAMLETDPCEGNCLTEPQALIASAYTSDVNSRRSLTAARSERVGVQDCVMSAWSRWAACSGSCGEGRQLRARSVIREPRNNGKPCPRNHLEARNCTLDPCPTPR